jgi:hypothetical protein
MPRWPPPAPPGATSSTRAPYFQDPNAPIRMAASVCVTCSCTSLGSPLHLPPCGNTH